MSSTSTSTSTTTAATFHLARKAARGTLVTLSMRLVSFVCTQCTLRFLDPKALGQALVQLDLLLTTVLFLSREGFRLALTKNLSDATWNVAWCSVAVVTVVSGTALGWHCLYNNKHDDPDFYLAGILYCLACCIEGWAEPAVLWELRQLNVATKASAEGLATVAKTLTTVFMLVVLDTANHRQRPVTAMGIAQLVYALVYAGFLYRKTWSQLVGPTFSWTAANLDRPTLYLVFIFTLQGLFKHFLTEGDRIVMATLRGTYDQGVYAMGSAYGGLAARLILQPLEENARLLWSRLAASISDSSSFSPNTTTTNDIATAETSATTSNTTASKDDDPNPLKQQQQQQQQREQHLITQQNKVQALQESYTLLVKLVLYVGFVFSFLAVNYTQVLLTLLAGRKWGANVEATNVLTAFCVYTAFLAWNGMTEAFVYAVAVSGGEIFRQLGVAHTVVGIIFAVVASFAVSHWGAVGLVAANCVAMLCRSVYSVLFAARYFSSKQQLQLQQPEQQQRTSSLAVVLPTAQSLLTSMFPNQVVLIAFVAAYWTTRWSQSKMQQEVVRLGLSSGAGYSVEWFTLAVQHVAVGVSCAVGLVFLVYNTERKFLQTLQTMWTGGGGVRQEEEGGGGGGGKSKHE